MLRVGLSLTQENLKLAHANNTLIISVGLVDLFSKKNILPYILKNTLYILSNFLLFFSTESQKNILKLKN